MAIAFDETTGYTKSTLTELRDFYRDQLLNDTMSFWLDRAVDSEYGGFFTAFDRDGALVDTDKSVWAQGRFTWLLGELYNNLEQKNEAWLRWAEQGGCFLRDFAFDSEDGRMWFHLTREGYPIRKRRYSFTESFAALAFGELALATGSEEYASLARRAFRAFIGAGLAPRSEPKFTNTRPTRSIGFPMIAIATAQQLRESIQLEDANDWIDFGIDQIERYHLHDDIQCVMEQVGFQGERLDHFDQRTLNPGHAIEAAWFILAEGIFRDDEKLIATGRKMLDWMWPRGWDPQHGGILYFVDVDCKPVQEYWHDMKFWWPHNETIIATLLAFLATNDPKYASWHFQVHQWAHEHFHDPQYGEWFGYLHRDGSISSTLKGNLWKGPFHVPRMQWVCWQLLDNHLNQRRLTENVVHGRNLPG